MYAILKYIHEHIVENLELTEVASHFGYSKWHFCSKFHQYTGKSFVKYVRHYRLQLAALDILANKKITEVAMQYGYDTLGCFNKAFLAEFGCLPREYKKHAKETQFYYERKKLTMYQLTDRCETLRKRVTGFNEYGELYCAQHRVYSTLGYIEAKKNKLTNMETIAAGIVNLLNKFNPVIQPEELIVGFNFDVAGDTNRYNEDFVPQNTPEHREILRKNGISEEDIEKGILTKEEAFELICCLWLKLYLNYDVQQSCVGGTATDGSCQVNELSYMMLDATEQLDFIRCMSVRYSESTPKEFLQRALEVVGHVQKGVPFFFNDDVMIPALVSHGISEKDAYDYTQIGCVETVIPVVNDSEKCFEQFAKIIQLLGNGVKEIELLKYNSLSESKYLTLGKPYQKFANDAQTDDEMKRLCRLLEEKIGRNLTVHF